MRGTLGRSLMLLLLTVIAVSAAVVTGFASRGEAAAQVAPSNTAPPVIDGTPAINEILVATTGTWTGTGPITYAYAWQRCNENGAGCTAVPDATQRTFGLTLPDVGSTIRVVVTATNADGSASSTSVPTAIVRGINQPGTGCPPVQQAGPIDADEIDPPARLLVDRQTITPGVITRNTQTIRLRFRVVACDGREIRGALVYATPTPYQQFQGTERPTDGDGWAELTLRRLRHFPVSNRQQLLVVFVRAREPGGGTEELLGGISSRRLVSFPVRLGG
jgi:hypothetical protein